MLRQSTIQLDPGTRNITPVLWVLLVTVMDTITCDTWIVRRSKNLNLDRYLASLTGWKGLMAAIVFQSWKDASIGDREALEWLGSTDCENYCTAIKFNFETVVNWVDQTKERFRKMDEKILELRRKIVDKKGLPGFCAELLRGETELEIKLDAEKLIRFIYPVPAAAMGQSKNIRATEH